MAAGSLSPLSESPLPRKGRFCVFSHPCDDSNHPTRPRAATKKQGPTFHARGRVGIRYQQFAVSFPRPPFAPMGLMKRDARRNGPLSGPVSRVLLIPNRQLLNRFLSTFSKHLRCESLRHPDPGTAPLNDTATPGCKIGCPGRRPFNETDLPRLPILVA